MSRIDSEVPVSALAPLAATALSNNVASWRRSLEQTQLASWFMSTQSNANRDGDADERSAIRNSSADGKTSNQPDSDPAGSGVVRTSLHQNGTRLQGNDDTEGASSGVTSAMDAGPSNNDIAIGRVISTLGLSSGSDTTTDRLTSETQERGAEPYTGGESPNVQTTVSPAIARFSMTSDVLDIVAKRLTDATAPEIRSTSPGQSDAISEASMGGTDGAQNEWRKRVTHAFMADDGLIVWLRDADLSEKSVPGLVTSANEWGKSAGLPIRKMYLNGHLVFERKDSPRRTTF